MNVSYPVKNGTIEHWDEMTALWEHIFNSNKIDMSPRQTKILLTESSISSANNRKKIAEILFEKFSFHSIGFGNQAALTLFQQGLTSGVVVNFHDDVTDICPVNFYPIIKLVKRIPSSENENLSREIFKIAKAVDAKARKEILKRIVLLGDTDVEALTVENEIEQLFLEQILENDIEKTKIIKIRVDKFPTHNDKSFLGGALLARVNKDKSEFWITRENYQENGANIFE